MLLRLYNMNKLIQDGSFEGVNNQMANFNIGDKAQIIEMPAPLEYFVGKIVTIVSIGEHGKEDILRIKIKSGFTFAVRVDQLRKITS